MSGLLLHCEEGLMGRVTPEFELAFARMQERAGGGVEMRRVGDCVAARLSSHAQDRAGCLRASGSILVIWEGECFPGLAPDRPLNPADFTLKALAGRKRFALALYDLRDGSLLLARDRSCERSLYFRRIDSGWLIASEPQCLARPGSLNEQIDPAYLAHWMAFRHGAIAHTLYRGVEEVPGQSWLKLNADGRRQQGLLEAPTAPSSPLSFPAAATAWASTLTTAIRDSAPLPTQTSAILLSGGMDSASIAALWREACPDRPAFAVSYHFPGLDHADESAYTTAIARQAGLSHISFDGRSFRPLDALEAGDFHPGFPLVHPWRGLRRHSLQLARGAGASRVLTGVFGDHLYPRRSDRLHSALAMGDLGGALRQCAWLLREGRRPLWREPALRRPFRFLKGPSRPEPPHWLSASARALLPQASETELSQSWLADQEAAAVAWFIERSGLEVAHPYRDPTLRALAAMLPAHWQFDGHLSKAVARAALSDALPSQVTRREHVSSMTPWLRADLRSRGTPLMQQLKSTDGAWATWIDAAAALAAAADPEVPERDQALLWLALSLDLWFDSLRRWEKATQLGPAAETLAAACLRPLH